MKIFSPPGYRANDTSSFINAPCRGKPNLREYTPARQKQPRKTDGSRRWPRLARAVANGEEQGGQGCSVYGIYPWATRTSRINFDDQFLGRHTANGIDPSASYFLSEPSPSRCFFQHFLARTVPRSPFVRGWSVNYSVSQPASRGFRLVSISFHPRNFFSRSREIPSVAVVPRRKDSDISRFSPRRSP